MKVCVICSKKKKEFHEILESVCIDCYNQAIYAKEKAFMRGIPKNES